MNLIDLKNNIINYCENIKYPESYVEHIKFKKLFDYEWKEIIKDYRIIDTITYKKPFEISFENNNIYFEEKYNINQRYVVRKTSGYVYDSDVISFNFQIIVKNDLLEIIKKLDEGDIIKLEISGFIKSVESVNLNNQIQCSHNYINIIIEIFEFKLIEKKEFNHDIESLKLELKKQPQIEIQNKEKIYLKINSFKDLLNVLLELDDLKYQSRQTKSDLNSFQNKVFNEKKIEEFNTKKKGIENYIGLEFNTICEVSEIRENIIGFKLYYRNKVFFFRDSQYDKNLQKEVFFLKNNSSVEINFKINEEIKDPFLYSINIELLSIKKNNKVKLFGKFTKLEFLYFGIYTLLVSLTLISFSKINFFGVIPFLIKLTLWVGFGYIINKLGVKYIYKN